MTGWLIAGTGEIVWCARMPGGEDCPVLEKRSQALEGEILSWKAALDEQAKVALSEEEKAALELEPLSGWKVFLILMLIAPLVLSGWALLAWALLTRSSIAVW